MNHMEGYLLVGLRRGVESSVGGRHMSFCVVGGNVFSCRWAQPFLGHGCKIDVHPHALVWVVFGVIDIAPRGVVT